MKNYLEKKDLYEALDHITKNFIIMENEKKTRGDAGEQIAQKKLWNPSTIWINAVFPTITSKIPHTGDKESLDRCG